MADGIGSWICKSLIQHDKQYGANLNIAWTGKRYCQIAKFTTYRASDCPNRQICGIVSDSTHHAEVSFDIEATDRFERISHASLTSHLRAVLRVDSFRFRLSAPIDSRAQADLPRVQLEILDWAIHSGDRSDCVFFEHISAIGRGNKDQEVEKVLRKWWFGQSNSSQSMKQPCSDRMAEAGPSRLKGRSETPGAVTSRVFISNYLDPYINPKSVDGKIRNRQIPDWLFEIPLDAEEELNKITVFGLDYNADPPEHKKDDSPLFSPLSPVLPVKAPSPPPTRSPAADNTTHYTTPSFVVTPLSEKQTSSNRESPTVPPCSISFPQPGQIIPSGTTSTPQPLLRSNASDTSSSEEDEGEDEIPIRAKPQPKRTKRPLFDNSAFLFPQERPSPGARLALSSGDLVQNANPPKSEGDASGVDSDDLSEYSRQERYKKRKLEITISSETMDVDDVEQSSSLGERKSGSSQSLALHESHSQSFPESDLSREDHGLARYAPESEIEVAKVVSAVHTQADISVTPFNESTISTSSHHENITTIGPQEMQSDVVVQEAYTEVSVLDSGIHVKTTSAQRSDPMPAPISAESRIQEPVKASQETALAGSIVDATRSTADRNQSPESLDPPEDQPGTVWSILKPLIGIVSSEQPIKEQHSSQENVAEDTNIESDKADDREASVDVFLDAEDLDELEEGCESGRSSQSHARTAYNGNTTLTDTEAHHKSLDSADIRSEYEMTHHTDDHDSLLDNIPSPPPDSPPARYRPLGDVIRRSVEPRSVRRSLSFTPTIERVVRDPPPVMPSPVKTRQQAEDVFGSLEGVALPEQLYLESKNAQLGQSPTPRARVGSSFVPRGPTAHSVRAGGHSASAVSPELNADATISKYTRFLRTSLPEGSFAKSRRESAFSPSRSVTNSPKRIRKLGGFRPDLNIPVGLGVSEAWALEAIDMAREYRARSTTRI